MARRAGERALGRESLLLAPNDVGVPRGGREAFHHSGVDPAGLGPPDGGGHAPAQVILDEGGGVGREGPGVAGVLGAREPDLGDGGGGLGGFGE